MDKAGYSHVILQYTQKGTVDLTYNYRFFSDTNYDSTLMFFDSFTAGPEHRDSTVIRSLSYDFSSKAKPRTDFSSFQSQPFWLNDSVRLERHVLYTIIVH